jgi:hypothetical protein
MITGQAVIHIKAFEKIIRDDPLPDCEVYGSEK